MWEISSHILVALTNINSSKLKFKCTKTEKDAFEEIKRVVDDDVLLAYSDFSEWFRVTTHASDF